MIFAAAIIPHNPRKSTTRWHSSKINKSNWKEFKIHCKQKLIQEPNNNDLINHFSGTLISITKETIPKTSNKCNTFWFNVVCKSQICQRQATICKFNNDLTGAKKKS